MSRVEDFLSPSEEAEIVEAIRTAEQNTSGEIRVHLEAHSKLDTFDRATEVFDFLHMGNTKRGNGVLIYVAVEDRTLAIMGDKGINDAVPQNFWEGTKDAIISNFKNYICNRNFSSSLCNIKKFRYYQNNPCLF